MQSADNVLTTGSPQTNNITPLPISPKDAERITTLTKNFKSRGHFDALRKDVFSSFYESVSKQNLIDSLNALAEKEVERDPGLLQRDRAKAALLLDGVVEREKEVYKGVEREVEDMVGWQRVRVEELVNRILSEVEGVELKHQAEEEGERTKLEEERQDILGAAKPNDENIINGSADAAGYEIQVQGENEVQFQLELGPVEEKPQELVPEQEDRIQRDLDRDRDITNLIQTHSNARSSTQLNSGTNSNSLTPIPSAPSTSSTITPSVPTVNNIDKDAVPSTFTHSSETPQREQEVNGATPTPSLPLDPNHSVHNHLYTGNQYHGRDRDSPREREPRERDRDRDFRDRDRDRDRDKDRDRDLPLSSLRDRDRDRERDRDSRVGDRDRDRDRDYRESRDRDRVRNRDRDYPTRSPRSRLYRDRSRDHSWDRSYRPRSGSRDIYRPRSRSRGRSRDYSYRPRDCSRSRDRSRAHRSHQDRSRERDRSRYRDRDRDRDRDHGKKDSPSSR